MKDISIEELNGKIIANEAKMSRLEDLLDSYKDLICEIKRLVGNNKTE